MKDKNCTCGKCIVYDLRFHPGGVFGLHTWSCEEKKWVIKREITKHG